MLALPFRGYLRLAVVFLDARLLGATDGADMRFPERCPRAAPELSSWLLLGRRANTRVRSLVFSEGKL